MRFVRCPRCAKQVPDVAMFCSRCGTNLRAPASAPIEDMGFAARPQRPRRPGLLKPAVLIGLFAALFCGMFWSRSSRDSERRYRDHDRQEEIDRPREDADDRPSQRRPPPPSFYRSDEGSQHESH